MKILYNDTLFQISYEQRNNILVLFFKKAMKDKELKNHMEIFFEYLKELKCSKGIADLRKVKYLTKDITEWIKNDWFPRLIQVGIKYWANIIDRNETDGDEKRFMDIDEKMREVKENYNIKVVFFGEIEKAREWLTSL